ncbi:nucleic acid binding OB-fold tRNA/helicase-type [Halovivax asiaticus JCM 14624]|uniref:Nucleic acid binding OB-fold tRNA/helicase-type n=1 Tax=Halovivax asiaticus JCM 14624 TaxID=1227490 RepID=M0BG08_9EURY|nr:OB-fold nucleic acid binding domain-containing protein [Halovivax asiaticus]ELZ08564.1 nucleic acid binding OB-fold tRNA/helicase-type [Halovivax asiaticus JCM 14624]
MGTCIICDTPVDGEVCEVHEEDVCFVFRGDDPSQLTPNRYYRGTVDGYADFGVFVDIGPRVTGLLHRSELDSRLESLDWEPGDTVFVQVLSVRDNGNVDLGWSIRESADEFRGTIVDDPDEGESRLEDEADDAPTDGTTADAEVESTPETESTAESDEREAANTESAPQNQGATASTASAGTAGGASTTDAGAVATGSAGAVAVSDEDDADQSDSDEADATLARATVDSLEDRLGTIVRLEGEITSVRQTSGPTVFELKDETGIVECAAFEEAGVRAYPDVDVDDIVSLEGEVERHNGDLQIETEALTVQTDEDATEIHDRLEAAIEDEARPAAIEPFGELDAVTAVESELADAATAIRRAVMESRPVVIRHSDTADGYTAAAGLEHAILPLIREKHTRDDAVYHYAERRPLEGSRYEMNDATGDVTSLLDAQTRHDELVPLVVVVDAGSTDASREAYELLDRYGADHLVVDSSHADDLSDAVTTTVTPSTQGVSVDDCTTTALAAPLASAVNPDVRDELAHLPALSYWEEPPTTFVDLATEAGYDATGLEDRRNAVALEAHYQSYNDKRELIADLLFDPDGDLAAHVSEQFRDKLETELETARENAGVRGTDGVTITVLDTAKYTHRFDFPPTGLLLDELHRRERNRTEPPFVTLGVDETELHVRATDAVDVRDLGDAIASAVPNAGVHTVGGADGHVEFLKGERAAVHDAAIDALGELLG